MGNEDKGKNRGRFKYYAEYKFQDVPKKNGKGTRRKRVYVGDFYAYVIPDEYKNDHNAYINRIKMFYMGIVLTIAALWIVSSFANPGGHSVFYVLPGYIVSVIPIGMSLFTLVELAFTQNPLYERAFADALGKDLRANTIAIMICQILTLVGQIVFMAINLGKNTGALKAGSDTLFAVSSAIIIALAWFFLKLQDSIKLEVVRK